MAVKPEDLYSSQDVKGEADRLEKLIDGKLMAAAKNFKGRVNLALEIPGDAVLKELKNRYKGWTINYISEHDGDYYEFIAN